MLARLRVPPPVVVAGAGVAGLAAAVELGRGSPLAAALLVQLKTLLDNADGQLARLTGLTSTFGRYLDRDSAQTGQRNALFSLSKKLSSVR